MTASPDGLNYEEVPAEALGAGKLYIGLVEVSRGPVTKFVEQVIVRIEDGLYRRYPGNQVENNWMLYKYNEPTVRIRKDQL